MTKKNRKIAMLLAVAVIIVLVFSAFLIAVEAEHDCIGDNCPICQLIAICENNLHNLSLSFVSTALAFVLTYKLITIQTAYNIIREVCTPVSLKVKLSN